MPNSVENCEISPWRELEPAEGDVLEAESEAVQVYLANPSYARNEVPEILNHQQRLAAIQCAQNIIAGRCPKFTWQYSFDQLGYAIAPRKERSEPDE